MTPIRCDAVAKVLNDMLKHGWDDYFYLFSGAREEATPAPAVCETTARGTRFLTHFAALGINYGWLQFSALKGDLPRTFAVADYLDEPSDQAVAKLMRQAGWGSGLIWSIYGHDGAVGYIALFRRENAVPAALAENTTEALLRWMPRFNAWARAAAQAQQEDGSGAAQDALSQRETQCLLMVADGKTSKEIARLLDISLRTVEFHIQNARKKLGGGPRSRAASRLVMLRSRQHTAMSALARSQFSRVLARS